MARWRAARSRWICVTQNAHAAAVGEQRARAPPTRVGSVLPALRQRVPRHSAKRAFQRLWRAGRGAASRPVHRCRSPSTGTDDAGALGATPPNGAPTAPAGRWPCRAAPTTRKTVALAGRDRGIAGWRGRLCAITATSTCSTRAAAARRLHARSGRAGLQTAPAGWRWGRRDEAARHVTSDVRAAAMLLLARALPRDRHRGHAHAARVPRCWPRPAAVAMPVPASPERTALAALATCGSTGAAGPRHRQAKQRGALVWMLPSALDATLLWPAAVAKYASWWLAGWLLSPTAGGAWMPSCCSFAVGNWPGWRPAGLFSTRWPARLCVNYLQDDQRHTASVRCARRAGRRAGVAPRGEAVRTPVVSDEPRYRSP